MKQKEFVGFKNVWYLIQLFEAMTRFNALYKKLFGTSLAWMAVLGVLVLSTGQASAIFRFIGELDGNFTFNAVVVSVGTDSFEVDKGGTDMYTIVVDSKTNWQQGLDSISDLEIGDEVQVRSRENQGTLLAARVRLLEDSGYGYVASECSNLRLVNVWVSSIQSDQIVLSRANVSMYVKIDGDTDFRAGDFEDLTVGQIITVRGEDCGPGGFYANRVVLPR